MRLIFLVFSFLFIVNPFYSQEESWFYLRAKDSLFQPTFKKVGNYLSYTGNDAKLKAVLSKYKILKFKKTYKKAKKEDLKRTFFVIADKKSLLQDLLKNASHIFKSGEIIPEVDRKIFEPNDYGLTSTIGDNIGLPVNLDYYDFLGAPKAWYYTTGSPDIIIGISDGSVDTTNIDFKGKTTVLHKSTLSGGHGYSIAENAAGQGDNGYGIPGICYDCDIFATNYGDFRDLTMVVEAANAGAKVINCSWIGTTYFEAAQDAVDKMFENGTIIVAAGGNKGWDETKGKLIYYPASYKHVISVGVVMYKYENILDNIQLEIPKNNYYAENIRGYVSRTMGFKDNDTLKKPHLYPVSTTTLNPEIDILAPSTGQFMFSDYLVKGIIAYHKYQTTSGAAPLVSGTIGLMFSLYPCLPVDEVESILKITATNIDDLEANKPYAGNYGAGMLNTGKAVELVYKLYSENETAYIEDQKFSRWDFKVTAFSEKVMFQNQKFTDSSSLNITAKHRIVLGKNTVLKPDSKGKIHLKIDPSLKKNCELRLRKEK